MHANTREKHTKNARTQERAVTCAALGSPAEHSDPSVAAAISLGQLTSLWQFMVALSPSTSPGWRSLRRARSEWAMSGSVASSSDTAQAQPPMVSASKPCSDREDDDDEEEEARAGEGDEEEEEAAASAEAAVTRSSCPAMASMTPGAERRSRLRYAGSVPATAATHRA